MRLSGLHHIRAWSRRQGSLTRARSQHGLGMVAPQDGVGGAKVLASPQYLGVHTVAGPWGAILRQEHGGPAEAVGWCSEFGRCVLHKACGHRGSGLLEPHILLSPGESRIEPRPSPGHTISGFFPCPHQAPSS